MKCYSYKYFDVYHGSSNIVFVVAHAGKLRPKRMWYSRCSPGADLNTDKIAFTAAEHIYNETKKRPWIFYVKIHRAFVDMNCPPSLYIDRKKNLSIHFYFFLVFERMLKWLAKKYKSVFVFDIHGFVDTEGGYDIIFGTQKFKTVKKKKYLLSFVNYLGRKGYSVGIDAEGYLGFYIILRASHYADAVQVEIEARWRNGSEETRNKFATDFAQGIINFYPIQ